MLVKLTGGTVHDPANGVDGVVRDIWIEDGRIVPPRPGARIGEEYGLDGAVVMAGGIDPHTHIGGGKVTIARTLLPEDHRGHERARTGLTRACCGHATPSTLAAGYRYAEMGYTCCFEPAMLPANARQAHLEMADTPMVDHGAYAMLGSDDLLLRMMAEKASPAAIKDYIAWTMHATQAIAVKVVNPGGISAFKFNARQLDLDERHPHYGVTPRDVLLTLARGLADLGVTHPLHVHGCNLGVPGNDATTLATIAAAAADGLPLHLTHLQFHAYGREGDRRFSSGAARIAEVINRSPNISLDVGQVLFGQTCTASGDSMRQYGIAGSAFPNKSVIMDIECDAGCGVVPMRYRDRNFVNALQWCIGLELFLLIEDPWRLFLTTDHPNGAPFTTYPHLIRLLMDRAFRQDRMLTIHPDALAASILPTLTREYTLNEIAILTRAGPARSLGLTDRGHLAPGAVADIAVYRAHADREAMFAAPELVFKGGTLVVKNGQIVQVVKGATHVARPAYDPGIEDHIAAYFDQFHTLSIDSFTVTDNEIVGRDGGAIVVHPTGVRTS
jgi:formylmethanofuran dehydrogenase subunit A